MPPPAWADGHPVVLMTPDGGPSGVTPSELIDVVFGNEHQNAIMGLRLQGYLQALGSDRLTDAQAAIRRMVDTRIEELVRHSLGPLSDAQNVLRSIANHLEDITARAERGALKTENVPTEDGGTE